jgi:osmotically-inducible protein OsmY
LYCENKFTIKNVKIMKTNESLQKDVQDAIKWEPLLHAAEIGVIVKDGIVTLTGTVNSYTKKLEAEDAAKKVAGVKAVVEKIEIKYGNSDKKDDPEIAKEVLNALKWNWSVPDDKIKVKVEKGWVTLDGEIDWHYQKESARNSIKNLTGVLGISNNLKVHTEVLDEIERKDIERALERNWSIDNADIDVDVHGNRVTLTGTVDSFYEKEEAERVAWNANGVRNVKNELVIEHDFF